jgi:hypothetical protein
VLVRPDIEAIVDRLTSVRYLPWLRVIDEAQLERPTESEADPETVVGPYRWLLARVGDGIRLTQAGYLPPAFVIEALDALGWRVDWYGKNNREEHARPLLELRESAQRYGLLRKNRGQLLVTKLGRRLVDDPVGLWWHVAEHLPEGRPSEPEWQAGVLYLLTVAAGRSRDDRLLAEGMSILGWVDGGYDGVSPDAAFDAVQNTWLRFVHLDLLPERTRWNEPDPPPTPQARALARAALLGREGTLPTTSEPTNERRAAERAVQLHVTLRDVEPAIWRRLVAPASLTLRELHTVLQTAMGWQDYHLHQFEIAGVPYGRLEDAEGEPIRDEDASTVGQAAEAAKEFDYDYDFGDGWTHEVRVEQVIDSVGGGPPRVLDGARACPPEDCGGAGGYAHLLDVLADPAHDDHETLLGWLGGSFDPEAFDPTRTNEDLELIDRLTRRRRRPLRPV